MHNPCHIATFHHEENKIFTISLQELWTFIQQPLIWIKWAKDQGLWDFLTAGAGLLISTALVSKWKKKIPEFSVFLTYSIGTGHKNYPNVLNIELRNLMDSPLVIGRPNFKFTSGLRGGRFAHGNTATGDYEIKFRPIGADGQTILGYSYTHVMLRHREQAYSYLPLPEEWSELDIHALTNNKHGLKFWRRNKGLGTLFLNVVLLKDEKPKVVMMEIPITNLVRGKKAPMLGREWD